MWLRSLFRPLRTRPSRPAVRSRRCRTDLLALEPLEDLCLPSFLAPVSYSVGAYPQAVVSADFNNDGRPDLAVANSSSDTVSVLLGNGDGMFQVPRNSTAGPQPISLSLGDLNGDGNLDLVTRNYTGTTQGLNVLLGIGDGTFQAPRSTPNALGNTPAIGDVNADGKPDLVSVWSDRVGVRFGNGDGTFAAPTIQIFATTYLNDGVLQDFNADGKLDLATSEGRVLLGNGDGTFATPTGQAAYWESVRAGDVNGDGIGDLVTRNGDTAGILLGNDTAGVGDGTFQPARTVTLFPPPENVTVTVTPNELALGDFNADGCLDVVATSVEVRHSSEGSPPVTWTGRVHVLLGRGDGTFALPRTSFISDSRLFASATGDFNGDGFSDVATTSLNSDTVKVLLEDGFWPLSLSVDSVTVTEGNDGTTNALFTVRLSSDPTQPVTVNYRTIDGSATAGSDYLATGGTLTFQPGGPLSQTVAVPVLGDRLAETEGLWVPLFQESFGLSVTDATGAAIAGSGIGTILDDEPTVSLDAYTVVTEGDVGTADALFTLRLSAPSAVPVTVQYATYDDYFDDPATAGIDYVPVTGTVTFAPGTTSQTVTVKVLGDTIPEGTYGGGGESFGVKLIGSPHAHVSDGGALGFIVDDDVSLSVGHATVREGNTGTINAVFWVTLSSPRSVPVTVDYFAAAGSALAGSDFAATEGTLTFAPGETRKAIIVPVRGDRLPEVDETFLLHLSRATNATIATGPAVGTIVDDEPRVSISDVAKVEGKKGRTTLFAFTVTLSTAYDQPVTVSFRTSDGTAKTSNSDYVAKSGTITFAPGETTKTITIEVKGDSKREADESFYLDLFGNSSNSLFVKPRGVGTILNDD